VSLPLLVRIGLVRDSLPPDGPTSGQGDDELPAFTPGEVATALLAWAAAYPDLDALRAAIRERRARLAELRRDDARLTLATAHSTKGLEFDHVAVLADGFPAQRSVAESAEPERELEEERRLAYVAWTRARRSLTLVYDPGAPSRFMLEAFSLAELGRDAAA
jgi:superfamily I DNA/RNA helicase